jgi:histidine ammonia-lyase
MNHLWARLADLFFSDSLGDLIDEGGGLLRYTGAVRNAELRLMAGPATLDIGPLDLGVEDHATNAPLTAQRTAGAIRILEDVLAIELLTSSTLAHIRPTGRPLPPAIAAAFDVIHRVREPFGKQPPAALLHAAVSEALCNELLDAALAETTGST